MHFLYLLTQFVYVTENIMRIFFGTMSKQVFGIADMKYSSCIVLFPLSCFSSGLSLSTQ